MGTPFLVGPRVVKPVYGARRCGACVVVGDLAPSLELECLQQVIIVSVAPVKNRRLTSIVTRIGAHQILPA
jgi:hypothetical protein